MKQVASLRYGVIFKKAFCDVDVFKGFVRDILGIHLEIDKVETEKCFDMPIGRVKPEYDLFAQDTKNRIIVDIQHKRLSDHYDRFLHYHAAALLEQVIHSTNYRPNFTVYTIVVLTSGDKHKKDVLVTDFAPHDLEGNYVNEIAHKIIFLCPKYLNEKTPKPYREWLEAIEDSLDGEIDETHYLLPEIQKIISHIEENDVSPEEKAWMIADAHLEELEMVAYEEGIQKGIKAGIEAGIQRGIETGIQKGIADGELKAKQTIAKNLLANGVDVETIVAVTGFSAIEIKKLV